MSKRLLTAILLIVLCVVVLLLNNGGPSVNIDFYLFKLEMLKSFAFFTFLGLGGLIGFMLR